MIVLGPANDVIFRRFLGDHLTREQVSELSEELDANFRREIGPHPPAIPGVRRFIEECHARGIVMAVASAAIAKNVKFLISALGLRDYFREVLAVDATTHPKPHPEIYLKTAEKLGVDPANLRSLRGFLRRHRSRQTRRDEMCRHCIHLFRRGSPPRNARRFDCPRLRSRLTSNAARSFQWSARAAGDALTERRTPIDQQRSSQLRITTSALAVCPSPHGLISVVLSGGPLQPESFTGLPQILFVGENSLLWGEESQIGGPSGDSSRGWFTSRCSRDGRR